METQQDEKQDTSKAVDGANGHPGLERSLGPLGYLHTETIIMHRE